MAVYRCTASGHTPEGELWVTGLFVEKVGGTTAAAAASWHTAFGLLWNGVASPADSIKQLILTTCGCDETVVNQLDAFFQHNVEQVRTGETLVGTSAASALPPQSSAVLSTRTALPTRSGRGRMYLPPFTEDAIAGIGELDAPVAAAIALAGKGMMEQLMGDGYQPVIAHRATSDTTNIISVDCSTIIGTQRRRRNKLIGSRASQAL